jgi:thiamine pyrophosphate-dependent acetolactate synthase large subunit-like protein
LTNTVTSLIESVRDRTPMLLLVGDTPVEDPDALQDIPQRGLVEVTGAGFVQVRTPHTVAIDVATAVRRAYREQRPIVLNIPTEFDWQEVEYDQLTPPTFTYQATEPASAAMDDAVGLIASSRRPIVLAGRGAASTQARSALIELAQRIGAPVATTLQGKDLFRGEPHNLDIFGTLSHEVALDAIGQSDCIIAVGASLNKWTTASGSLLNGKRSLGAS